MMTAMSWDLIGIFRGMSIEILFNIAAESAASKLQEILSDIYLVLPYMAIPTAAKEIVLSYLEPDLSKISEFVVVRLPSRVNADTFDTFYAELLFDASNGDESAMSLVFNLLDREMNREKSALVRFLDAVSIQKNNVTKP